jgi:hypothetical protein
VLASAAVLAWSGANTANFGDTSIGSVSTLSVFTLTNQGPGAASLNSIAVGGGQAAEFLLGGTCAVGASLAANANCTISVAFAPSQVGARTGTLDVMTNGSAPAPVALSGNGVMSAQQVLGLSTPAITFPPVAAGQSAAPMPVRVTNTGTSPLTVTALQLTTGSFSATPATGALPVTLAPAQSLDINVSLVSGAAGSGILTDTLTVMTNTAGLSRALAVSATVDAGAAQQTPGNTNVGAGGCVPGEHGVLFDPMLAGMCLLALYLVRRRRQGT